MKAPAFVVLGPSALPLARRLQNHVPGSTIHALGRRMAEHASHVDVAYEHVGEHLRSLYAAGTPTVAMCAAGIVIRALAPALVDGQKDAEPPVLAVAEDGSAVVPLLGGLAGVNDLARDIAAALAISPAITTSGELRFGTCVLNPPEGYALASLDDGKRFVAELLAGASVRIEGDAPWLDGKTLPVADHASHVIRITPAAHDGTPGDLRIHPRCVALAWDGGNADETVDAMEERLRGALAQAGLAFASLAVLLVPRSRMRDGLFDDVAERLHVPIRYVTTQAQDTTLQWMQRVLPAGTSMRDVARGTCIAIAASPIHVAAIGEARGKVTVVGLGPGHPDFMIPAARAALDDAEDILGYTPYVAMAGPLKPGQQAVASDNREEMDRARHAFRLAAQGRRVAIVSSGDPGIFAMAAAAMEALASADDPRWHDVAVRVLPGVSAAMATAAQAGAPLGHDFCLISLSDNLKPWEVIERRLRLAAEADLVMGFYNPISRQRPWQLGRAIAILREYRADETPVVLGRDITRPGERLTYTTLGQWEDDRVDMRTTVIVGSSTTRHIPHHDGHGWIYTPRWYPSPPTSSTER